MFRRSLVFCSFLSISIALTAQNHPAAEGPSLSLWAGAEISTFNPDYGCGNNSAFTCWNHQLLGIAPFVDVNGLFLPKLGAEGEARFLHWRGPSSGFTQSSYLAGPRYQVFHFRRKLSVDAKLLVGDAHINLPAGAQGTGTYFAYAPGVAANFRVSRRVMARAEYEYQRWPSFGNGGLTPNGLSIGASYAILR